MRNVDTERCGECPFYRKKGLFRRERCDFPKVPVPRECPRIGGGPRILRYDEALASGIVWIEWRQTGELEMMMLEYAGGVVLCGMTPKVTYDMDVSAPRERCGVLYRFWDRRPTEEQREAEMWEC